MHRFHSISAGQFEVLEPRVLLSFSLKVDFAAAGTAVPSGHVGDNGQLFADRGNGYSYGWSGDNSANMRARSSSLSPEARLDTLAMMQKDGTFTWEVAVPEGTYRVHIVAGDPAFPSGTQHVRAEGVDVVNEYTAPLKLWAEG